MAEKSAIQRIKDLDAERASIFDHAKEEVLEKAKAQGDLLVVGVNSDASVRRLEKAPGRPINQWRDRAEVVADLQNRFGDPFAGHFATVIELARQHHLPLLEDLGSGSLVELGGFGIRDEPPAGASLKAGVDVVTFSGDKLLGAPQAGILTGKREPLERIRRNPLFRALRVDKLTIAALEATIAIYLRGDLNEIPALRMIQISPEVLGRRAASLTERVACNAGLSVKIEQGESVVGGGSTPGQSLPTSLIAISHVRLSAQDLEHKLRHNNPPIIARVERDQVLLDLRTVFEDQEEVIVKALGRLGKNETQD